MEPKIPRATDLVGSQSSYRSSHVANPFTLLLAALDQTETQYLFPDASCVSTEFREAWERA